MKITLLFFFYSASSFSQTITGKVLNIGTNDPIPNATVCIYSNESKIRDSDFTTKLQNYFFLQGDWYKIITQTKTDSLGQFKFINLSRSIYNVCASIKVPFRDSFYAIRQDYFENLKIRPGVNYYKIFRLQVTCPFDKTKNQSFCPVCKKSDKLLPVYFGLPLFDSTGETGRPKEYHDLGCIVDTECMPTKYCKRCKKEF